MQIGEHQPVDTPQQRQMQNEDEDTEVDEDFDDTEEILFQFALFIAK